MPRVAILVFHQDQFGDIPKPCLRDRMARELVTARAEPNTILNRAINVVIVTLDRHLSSSVARAEQALRAQVPGLSISVHAAVEWSANPATLADAKAAVAKADIIVACMLFIDDQVQAILPALVARRDQCTVMMGCVSAPEIVKLTKMGQFDMTASAKGPMALLKKLRGKSNPGEKKTASGAGQMAMLRRLPKLLKYVPGTAQDLRIYFLIMQYWLSGSDENVSGMLQLLVTKYIVGGKIGNVPPPVEYPEVGFTIRGWRIAYPSQQMTCLKEAAPVPSVCCFCALTSSPTMRATMTA